MYKFMAFIKRKSGVSSAEFMRYYEEQHVPLLIKMFPEWNKAKVYRRNYLQFDDNVVGDENYDGGSTDTEFDVVTELVFEHREDADALLSSAFKNPENYAVVRADEDNFIEPGRAKMFVVKVHETFS